MSKASERSARLAAEPMRQMSVQGGFIGGLRQSLAEIWERRELLDMLVRREIRARFKDSSLGLVWSLIRPLVQLLIYYVAIGKFLEAERAIPDFAIYVFTGLTTWQFFSEIVSSGTVSIIANSGIIKKIHLPREIFPLSSVGSAVFNFSIQLTILVLAALLIRGINVDSALLHLPAAILLVLIWGTAFALFLSAANVYLRDVQHLVEVALLVGFWLSPIVYSWEMVSNTVRPLFAEIYLANPVTLAVLAMQRTMWLSGLDKPYPDHLGLRLVIAIVVGLAVLVLAQRLFNRMQRNFAQEI